MKKRLMSIGILLLALVVSYFGYTLDPFLLNNDDNVSHEDAFEIEGVIDNEEHNDNVDNKTYTLYQFRNQYLLESHYEKHKDEFGDITMDEYLDGANDLINQVSDSVLSKLEDDGDYLFYNTDTMEFGVLSSDGYIRTYFIPEDGIKYFNRK